MVGLRNELSNEQSAKKQLEVGYTDVCEERDLALAERNGHSDDLDAIRDEYADVERQLAERVAKIGELDGEIRGLKIVEAKFYALFELVTAFVTKLLGKRDLIKEIRYDKSLFNALDAMFKEAASKSLDEHNREFEELSKSAPRLDQVDQSKDNMSKGPGDS